MTRDDALNALADARTALDDPASLPEVDDIPEGDLTSYAIDRLDEVIGMLRDQGDALTVVCEAAEAWQTELEEYVIPAADEDSAEGYTKRAADIGAALATLRGEVSA